MDVLRSFKSSDPFPRTHNALNDYYQFHFRESVRRGDQDPFVWPYRSFGTYLMLAYLLLPPTKSKIVRYAFYPVFAFFSYWSLRSIFEAKSASMPVTYLIGIGNSWSILWIASRTIFNDYRTARRVERQSEDSGQESTPSQQDKGGLPAQEQSNLTRRRVNGKSEISTATSSSQAGSKSYYWQTLPSKFSKRFDFIFDLLCSFRGPGWAHQARSIPGPPDYIASQLDPPPPSTKPTVRDYENRQILLRSSVIRFLKFQVYLDVIKTLMAHDPYFLGFVEPRPPAPAFLPEWIRSSPVLTQWYRLILAMYGTRTALAMIFNLSPLFFSGVLGPSIMGLRADSWYYSDFGGDWRYLLSHGIAGWWGSWWHQVFRLGFEAPAKWTCEKLGIPQRSVPGKIITLFIVFTCSGLVHASGSISINADTNPLSGPILFFQLQALGILIEAGFSHGCKAIGITQKTPEAVRKVITAIWLATWAYYTGPLIIEDFSRGGVWLFEPVPFSVLKMLGFGEPNDHWWRWRARNIFWYTGDKWWKSGIAC